MEMYSKRINMPSGFVKRGRTRTGSSTESELVVLIEGEKDREREG